MTNVRELCNFSIDPETLATVPVGDNRETESLVICIDPTKTTVEGFLKGRPLNINSTAEAIVGDSVAHAIFSPNRAKLIALSDPLVQGVKIREEDFRVVGVVVDATNNGQVIYVPLQELKTAAHVRYPNIVFVRIAEPTSLETPSDIESKVSSIESSLAVVWVNQINDKNTEFLESIWSIMMFLPLFTIASGALCLVGYMKLATDEQKQELGTLRATGGRPRLFVAILAFQSMIVLLAGFGIGVSLGTVVTVLVLIANPVITSLTVLEIVAGLLSVSIGMFVLTLYPAFRMARSSILKLMS